MAGEPDLVLHGGTVLTMVGDRPDRPIGGSSSGRRASPLAAPDTAGTRASAVAISGGTVAAVGSDDEVLPLAGPATRIVDLGGRAVVPGFQDAHAHPLAEGVRARWLDLRSSPDLRAALLTVRRSAGQSFDPMNPDRWVEAVYHPGAWPEARHPTRDELDRAAPDVPVLLHHGSGHAVAANSLALALAGVIAERADLPGAAIVRDKHGEPTGLVLGSSPDAPFASALPPIGPSELREALRLVGVRLAAAGVTAISDADLGALGDPVGELAAYARAVLDGDLAATLTIMPGIARLATADEDPPTPEDIAALVPRDVAGRIRVGAAKLYADGALSTGDAWLRAPYADAGSRPDLPAGRPAFPPGELEERIRRAHDAGWQLGVHAIGDAGIAAVLRAYRAALEASPRPDHRHRIEHAIVLPDDLLREMLELGVVAVVQPEFVARHGDDYVERLGRDRAASIYAYRRWLDAGLPVAFGSDRPVTDGAPLAGIRAAMRHAGASGRPLAAGQRPDVAEALAGWTEVAAWAAFDESRAGRIVDGAAADLVILSGDPVAVPARAWAAGEDGVQVVATIVAGIPVYGSDELGERIGRP